MKKLSVYLSTALKELILSLFFIIAAMQGAKAYTGECTPDSGTYNYRYNFGMLNVVDPKGNKPGYLFPRPYQWNLGSVYTGTCDCDPANEGPDSPIPNKYFQTRTSLASGHKDGTRNFFIINDYLEVATSVWVEGGLFQYVDTPWSSQSNEYASLNHVVGNNGHSCKSPDLTQSNYLTFTTGSKGQLWMYITKSFVGDIYIPDIKVEDIYASMTPDVFGGTPVSSIWINGQISVPQKCEINAGQIITIDFGKIWSGDFTTKGQKPLGYVEKQIKASMKCNNINAYTNLTVRFESETTPEYPDAIKTNNPDVGVELIDDSGKLILPNTGLIPFQINENYEATVTFKAAPISTTGNVPTAGQFQALAYIRVDFA